MRYEANKSQEPPEQTESLPIGSRSRQIYRDPQQVFSTKELAPGQTYERLSSDLVGDARGYPRPRWDRQHTSTFTYLGPVTKEIDGKSVEDPDRLEIITHVGYGDGQLHETTYKADLGLEPYRDGSWNDCYTIDPDKETNPLSDHLRAVQEKLRQLFDK